METESHKLDGSIFVKIPSEMIASLRAIAKEEFNTVPGICRKFISDGIEKRKKITQVKTITQVK